MTWSSTASTLKVAEAAPAAMITLVGTAAWLGLLLVRLTVSACELSMLLRVTVPVVAAAPVFSAMLCEASTSVSEGSADSSVRLSRISRVRRVVGGALRVLRRRERSPRRASQGMRGSPEDSTNATGSAWHDLGRAGVRARRVSAFQVRTESEPCLWKEDGSSLHVVVPVVRGRPIRFARDPGRRRVVRRLAISRPRGVRRSVGVGGPALGLAARRNTADCLRHQVELEFILEKR